MNFKKQTLKNGLTVITVPIKDSLSVTALVMVHTGSKYETKEINGLSHFLEHMCFKGTKKRPKSIDISMELDSIGSQSNAFTAQEFTGYYAKAEPSHLDAILDVVSDIYNNSILPAEEIEKEKGVIIGEINMYEDIPQHVVHEEFMKLLYGDQPAGWPIIGPKENISRMTQQDFLDYRAKHYVASATTVIVSGSFDEASVIGKIEKLFSEMSEDKKETKILVSESQSKPELTIKNKTTDQTHLIIGLRTFGSKDKRKTVLKILSTVLGGGMSSRLFQRIREQMGLGYYVRSGVDEYTDHGYLAVSAGVDNNRLEEGVSAILDELRKLTLSTIPDVELQKAKDYLIGNMYLGLESSDSLAEYYAIQDILSDEMLTPDELTKKLRAVTAEEVQGLAKQIFTDKGLNMSVVGNVKDRGSLEKIFHF